jgi:hypothetical protein
VTAFHLFRDFAVDATAEDPPMSSGTAADADGEHNSVGLMAYVRFRDRAGVFSNWMHCMRNEKGLVRCGVECDGGGFRLRVAGPSLLADNDGFVVTGGCGASEDEREREEFVRPGADDRTFRLDPQPLAACIAERDALKPTWTKLGPPLRERFDREEELCFSRGYDDAHLASHRQQTVRHISVHKAAGVRAKPGDFPVYELTFRIELKDGRRVEKKTTCQPDKYAYACTHDPDLDTVRDYYLTRAGDNQIMLRDRRGRLAKLFGVRLGTDDRMFRLQASPVAACKS